MIRIFLVIIALASSCLGQRAPLAPQDYSPLPAGMDVAFSSDGDDIVARVAEYIGLAKKEVLISQYAITDHRVLQAISSAFQRGVVVGVLIDSKPALQTYDTPRYLRSLGIPVIYAKRGINGSGWHNQRYVVIDRETVILTSADLTINARENSENLVALANASIATRFYNLWLEEAGAGKRLP